MTRNTLGALFASLLVVSLSGRVEAQLPPNLGDGLLDPTIISIGNFPVSRASFFVAGSGGSVLRYQTSTKDWKDVSISGESRRLLGLRGSSAKNIWVGARHTTAEDLHVYGYDGAIWTQHVIGSPTLPPTALFDPRPGGIWSFGRTHTYVAVVSDVATRWWLMRWDGAEWHLLTIVQGGRASGGMYAVNPIEMYFVGEPDGAPGLWRWTGGHMEQVPAGSNLPTLGALNGVMKTDDTLIVSGITDSGRQAIWRGTWGSSFTKEFEATHTQKPVMGEANNWCLTDNRRRWVVGVDSANRAALYKKNAAGNWISDTGLAAEGACSPVMAAPGAGSLFLALNSCSKSSAGNDVHAILVDGGGWTLENPPGKHVWSSVWGAEGSGLIASPAVIAQLYTPFPGIFVAVGGF